MIEIIREITAETYANTYGKPMHEVEELLFTWAEVMAYGVYGYSLYTTEEKDGTHYWVKFLRGRSCD